MKEYAIAPLTDPAIDAEAFVLEFQQPLWLWARLLGCDEASADDLTQETLIKCIEDARAGKFQARSHSESLAWLRTSAKHLFLTKQRKQHRRDEILKLDAAEVIWERRIGDQPSADSIWLEALGHCLEALRESEGRLARVVNMHYQSGQSGEEIAQTLDTNTSHIHVLLHRARAKLRECIERRTQHAKF